MTLFAFFYVARVCISRMLLSSPRRAWTEIASAFPSTSRMYVEESFEAYAPAAGNYYSIRGLTVSLMSFPFPGNLRMLIMLAEANA